MCSSRCRGRARAAGRGRPRARVPPASCCPRGDPELMRLGRRTRSRTRSCRAAPWGPRLASLAPVALLAAVALLTAAAFRAPDPRGAARGASALGLALAGGATVAATTIARAIVLSTFDTSHGDAVVGTIWDAYLGDLRLWGLAAGAIGLIAAAVFEPGAPGAVAARSAADRRAERLRRAARARGRARGAGRAAAVDARGPARSRAGLRRGRAGLHGRRRGRATLVRSVIVAGFAPPGRLTVPWSRSRRPVGIARRRRAPARAAASSAGCSSSARSSRRSCRCSPARTARSSRRRCRSASGRSSGASSRCAAWTGLHAPGWVIHVSTVGGALAAAVATHDTGGAGSPARFLLMLVLVFAAYFFPAREAWPYLGVVLVLHGAAVRVRPRPRSTPACSASC